MRNLQFAKAPLRPLHARSENGEKEIKLDNFIRQFTLPFVCAGAVHVRNEKDPIAVERRVSQAAAAAAG
jgi:hypothetical protein